MNMHSMYNLFSLTLTAQQYFINYLKMIYSHESLIWTCV